MPDSDPPSPRQTAVVLRQQGFSLRQIGRRVAVHPSVVARWVRDVPPVAPNAAARAEQLSVRRDDAVYQRALALRRAGWSYTMIATELGVSKSTLSGWLRQEPRGGAPALHRSQQARSASGATKRMTHQALVQGEIAAAADEIARRFAGGVGERDVFVAGLMLYWAEGRKTNGAVELVNSDPVIIKLFVLWVGHYLGVTPDRLRICIHLYPDTDIADAEQYWSDATQIPRHQFYKAHVDTRADKAVAHGRKLPFGTAHVKVVGRGSAALHRTVLGWIAGIAALMVQ